MDKRLLTEQETAKYLGVTLAWLRWTRYSGPSARGPLPPPYIRVGSRSVRYDIKDLEKWLASNRVEV